MPCNDYPPNGYNDCSRQERRADLNARIACEALSALGDTSKLSKEAQVWWKEHQEVDRRRRRREQEERERNAQKAKALAKLTPEERKALGLW